MLTGYFDRLDMRLIAQDVSGTPEQINPYLDGWCVSEPPGKCWFSDRRCTLVGEWEITERRVDYFGVGLFDGRLLVAYGRFHTARFDLQRGDKLTAEIRPPHITPLGNV